MAEAPSVVQKGVEELEKEIMCPVCHDKFQEPKILPCCHYYCEDCIVTLAQRSNPFACPECRSDTLLPQSDPNQLPTAFFVNRMKELHSKMEKADGKVEAKCEQCSGGKAVAFCRQCAEFICDWCAKSHQRMKAFSGHKVVTLEELKEGRVKQIPTKQPPPPMCEKHNEPMKMYCYDCSCFICRDCIVIDHAGHKYEFVLKAVPQTRKELVNHLSPLKEAQVNICNAVDVVKVTKLEVVAQRESVAERIEHSFQELHEILDQCKHQLLTEVAKKVQEKVGCLSIQEKELNTASAMTQSLIDLCQRNVENSTDEELMTHHKHLLRRIDKEVKEQLKRAINLDPDEEVDVGIKIAIADSLRQLCQREAKVISLPADPSKCTVDGPGLNTAEINETTHVVLQTVLHNGTPTKKPQKIDAQLKSLVNRSVVEVEGVRKEGNKYEIKFTPKIRGRHQLTINVNDSPVGESPFPVYVRIPPTKLGRPVRIISGLNGPYGVAINSTDEVIVTESKSIFIFNKNGKKLRNIKLSTDNVNLTGVAVGQNGTIYLTDIGRHCLMRLNKDGKILRTVGKKGSGPQEFNAPRGVAVIGDQVIVCDSGNHRLQVFTTELEFVKTIGSQGQGNGQFKNVRDISHDEVGHMYVCDCGNNRVQVFNGQGEFQHSFSRKGDGQLNWPSGVCVVDKFVYVVEFGSDCVSVFCKDGQFVTSFGKNGIKQGKFRDPRGICVDHDYFVYVCDFLNNRIQIF